MNSASTSLVLAGGPDSIDVSGETVSTRQEKLAGDASTFPASSTARTPKLCSPSSRPSYSCGELHSSKSAPSSEHSNDPASSAANTKAALVPDVTAAGANKINVSGATVSTRQR